MHSKMVTHDFFFLFLDCNKLLVPFIKKLKMLNESSSCEYSSLGEEFIRHFK